MSLAWLGGCGVEATDLGRAGGDAAGFGGGSDAQALDRGRGGGDGARPTPDAAPVEDAGAPLDAGDPDLGPADGGAGPDAAHRPPDAGGADGGTFVDPDHPCVRWARVGAVQIFAYEASRPDATARDPGAAAGACSQPGVLPAAGLDAAQAAAACAAVDARLCTDAEWQAACAGEAGSRGWPYGDRHDPGRCNDHLAGSGALEPTGGRPECVSREGIFDLSGNLWERTADDLKRGASFKLNAVAFRAEVTGCHAPYDVLPGFADDDLGFRCCR